MITVLPHRAILGWDRVLDDGRPGGVYKTGARAGEPVPVEAFPAVPLRDALASVYPGDAHAVCYTVRGRPRCPRINAEGLDLLRSLGGDLAFGAVFVDVDGEGHGEGAEASQAWSATQIAKVRDNAPRLWAGCAWYLTRGGFRLVWELPGVDLAAYLGILPRVYAALDAAGIPMSARDGHGLDAFTDWQHLYRLPRTTRDRGAPPVDLPRDLDRLGFLDVDALPEAPAVEAPAGVDPGLLEALDAAGVDDARRPGRMVLPPRIVSGEKPGGAGRETWLVRYAGSLRAQGIRGPQVLDALILFNEARCEPAKPLADLQRIAASSGRWRDPDAEARAVRRDTLPAIQVRAGALAETVAAAEDALDGADLYQRAGEIVAVYCDPDGPVIRPVKPAGLRVMLAERARWFRVKPPKDEGGEPDEIPTDPPKDVVDGLHSLRRWGFPVLQGITESPTLRPDGTILDAPGYDQATGVEYVQSPGVVWPEIPAEPSRFQVARAVEALAEVVEGFPFQGEAHRAVALAALVTAVVRPAVDGPAPLFVLDATTPASGKSLLATAAGILATGRPPAAQAQVDPVEFEKRITALLTAGARVVMVDNVDRPLGGGGMDAALTADTWAGRVLGRSEIVEVRNRATWIATGNNVVIRGDLARRCLRAYMDPGVERPELRGGFRHPDLLGWIREARPRLVAAVLTICRGYVAAGRPEVPGGSWGGFGTWVRMVRDPLVWAGCPDPLATRAEIRAEADVSLEAWRYAIRGLRGLYGDREFTATELAEAVGPFRAAGSPEHEDAIATLRESLTELAGDGKGNLDGRRIGWVLRRQRGRVIGGLALVKGEAGRRGAAWKVEIRNTESGSGNGNGNGNGNRNRESGI